MNTTQQTRTFGSNSEVTLESNMASLLQMTNDVVSKIKLQTQEISV